MHIAIINMFETYGERAELISKFFNYQGYKVTNIESNFQHFKKEFINNKNENTVYIDTKPYYKNLSAKRLLSHAKFSKDAFKKIKSIKPDIIYIIIPANSLVKDGIKYKKENNVKLIFDVMDLWPETFPDRNLNNFPPFIYWRNLRDKNLKHGDYIITECKMFLDVLKPKINNIPSSVIYLAKEEIDVINNLQISDNEINLAYLGSINNIIDIDIISKVIYKISKVYTVNLHVIGDGEKKDELIHQAEFSGANVIYHGKIYDKQAKQDIFDKCDFGLNIMKDSVTVGLTMKSVDYFQHGLPIINNIPFDTEDLVLNYKIGINYRTFIHDDFKIEDLKSPSYREKVSEVFNNNFSVSNFNKMMFEVMRKI